MFSENGQTTKNEENPEDTDDWKAFKQNLSHTLHLHSIHLSQSMDAVKCFMALDCVFFTKVYQGERCV